MDVYFPKSVNFILAILISFSIIFKSLTPPIYYFKRKTDSIKTFYWRPVVCRIFKSIEKAILIQ